MRETRPDKVREEQGKSNHETSERPRDLPVSQGVCAHLSIGTLFELVRLRCMGMEIYVADSSLNKVDWHGICANYDPTRIWLLHARVGVTLLDMKRESHILHRIPPIPIQGDSISC